MSQFGYLRDLLPRLLREHDESHHEVIIETFSRSAFYGWEDEDEIQVYHNALKISKTADRILKQRIKDLKNQ